MLVRDLYFYIQAHPESSTPAFNWIKRHLRVLNYALNCNHFTHSLYSLYSLYSQVTFSHHTFPVTSHLARFLVQISESVYHIHGFRNVARKITGSLWRTPSNVKRTETLTLSTWWKRYLTFGTVSKIDFFCIQLNEFTARVNCMKQWKCELKSHNSIII